MNIFLRTHPDPVTRADEDLTWQIPTPCATFLFHIFHSKLPIMSCHTKCSVLGFLRPGFCPYHSIGTDCVLELEERPCWLTDLLSFTSPQPDFRVIVSWLLSSRSGPSASISHVNMAVMWGWMWGPAFLLLALSLWSTPGHISLRLVDGWSFCISSMSRLHSR